MSGRFFKGTGLNSNFLTKVNTVVLGLKKSFYCFWISPPANTPTLSNLVKMKPWRDFCFIIY